MSKGIFVFYRDIYNKQRPSALREQSPLSQPLGAPLPSLTSSSYSESGQRHCTLSQTHLL